MATINALNNASAPFTVTSGDLTVTSGNAVVTAGNVTLPTTTSSVGQITVNGSAWAHAYGTNNVFLGGGGNFTLTGSNLVGIGSSALSGVTSGTDCTAIGYQTLTGVQVSGKGNCTAVGYQALQNSTGVGDTAIGYQAANAMVANSNTTAVGYQALLLATGTSNTAVGYSAGSAITTGAYNCLLGYNAGTNYTSSESSNICINSPGVAAESNVLRIGAGTGAGNQQINVATICGITGKTSASGIAVLVNSSDVLGTTTSSKRFKNTILDMATQSDKLIDLRPVTFYYNQDDIHVDANDAQLKQYGLIAEEVINYIPELVSFNQSEEIESVRYMNLIPMLLNEWQKLNKRLIELEK